MKSKGKSVSLLLILLLAISVGTLTIKPTNVNAQTSQYSGPSKYYINVKVSSPIQGQTYSNKVPLSFSFTTNIDNYTGDSVVFNYNLDGQGGFDVFGNPVFSGKTTRIGQFYLPVPLTYNTTIDVPAGKHTLFVMVTYWLNINGDHQKASSCSQTVNFTSSPTISNQVIIPLIALILLIITLVILMQLYRRRKRQV
jgi:hypothetical protein